MGMKGERYAASLDPAFVRFVVDELPFLPFEAAIEFYLTVVPKLPDAALAFLGCNDRFWLLTFCLRRQDGINEWVYDRAREVESAPDNRLDLWARYHYKSSIITFAGSIQEICIDPEITIGIFSNTQDVADPFLAQIMSELEENALLKRLYADVFWQDPRKEAPLWSRSEGIVVKRKGNPKEATVRAHGIMEAIPTGLHYRLRIYNDIVTEKSVSDTATNQMAKTTRRWEMSQNLGTHDGGRKWHEGTRYHFADTYGVLIERRSLKPRIYPATHNGRLDGKPVFLTAERWAEVKRDQRSTAAAQMLLNPLAGEENTFLMEWLRPFAILPRSMNVYILGDPSMGKTKRSDRTALMVIGVDPNKNYYLIDGYCHRMKLTERWRALRDLFVKWKGAPGVQMVRVGYERYGLQTDQEYFEIEINREKIEGFAIDEVSWTREGDQSKSNRIRRIEPYFRNSQWWMPPKVWHPDYKVACTWKINAETQMLEYQPVRGQTREELRAIAAGERYRIMEPLRRLDEDGNVYDVTRAFAEEFRLHPFAPHDDVLDSASRIVDMEPVPPVVIERMGQHESRAEHPD
jgi:hypothetical protein